MGMECEISLGNQNTGKTQLKHFYIPEEQSIYLLAHKDAKKLKDWIALCERQLSKLGYRNLSLIGKGAYGFVFGGTSLAGQALVFKFSRITLPQHIRDRLEEEAFMLSQVSHSHVPELVEFEVIGKQSILKMERALGQDLEKISLAQGPLPPKSVIKIAVQIGRVLLALRRADSKCHDNSTGKQSHKQIVHGDIKPSNLVWETESQNVSLIDWGSSVFAQVDSQSQYIGNNVMDLMSNDCHQSNARLGDVYFIGDEQLNGALSSPRFDEQGLANTLYALASGQGSRFGKHVIRPNSLGLPSFFARILEGLMSDNKETRNTAGDYFFRHLHVLEHLVVKDESSQFLLPAFVPTWLAPEKIDIDTVVYSSRKSFLRQEGNNIELSFQNVNDAQFARYYKNYMQGMGDTEKAFICAISRLSNYPVVGGLVFRWEDEQLFVNSSLYLFDEKIKKAFDHAVGISITLARAIDRKGVFKCCLFNAKNTIHIERDSVDKPFYPTEELSITFDTSLDSSVHISSHIANKMHSYFEDGDDPDELLKLPQSILDCLTELNDIHHTGCVIFEALPTHLKVHNYYRLLDHSENERFASLLDRLVSLIPEIKGLGISGFMKLPYKDARSFSYQSWLPDNLKHH